MASNRHSNNWVQQSVVDVLAGRPQLPFQPPELNFPANLLLLVPPPAFLAALLALYNHFYNSTDQQKSHALAKINAALKVG